MAGIDERFTAYVRDRGEHHLRVAVLLTGDWHTAEDLTQASLVKLYRAWPKLRQDSDPDAYLRRIMVNTHRSWWRARWRRETLGWHRHTRGGRLPPPRLRTRRSPGPSCSG